MKSGLSLKLEHTLGFGLRTVFNNFRGLFRIVYDADAAIVYMQPGTPHLFPFPFRFVAFKALFRAILSLLLRQALKRSPGLNSGNFRVVFPFF